MNFEEWWTAQKPEEMWDGTWANVSKIKEIAEDAWDAGFNAATDVARDMLDVDLKKE